MSRLVGSNWKTLGVWLAFALGATLLVGCGGGPKESEKAPKKTPTEQTTTKDLVKERERELELKRKLDTFQMPDELAKEWFYDGDGTYELSAEWQADGSRVRLAVTRPTGKGTRPKSGAELKLVIGFYGCEFPRGPYKNLARVLGSELTLPQQFPLKEVQHRWYRAVVFDDAGSPMYFTDPVQPSILDHRPKAVQPPDKKKPPAAGTAGPSAKKSDEKQEKPDTAKVAATPEKRIIAVAPLYNATEKDPLERVYFGRGIGELLREFLSGIPELDTPDQGYTDVVIGRQRGQRRQLTAATLAGVARTVGADALLTGSFQLTEQNLKIDLCFVNAESGAAMMAPSVTSTNDASDDMGKTLAAELSRVLRIEFDEGRKAKFSVMWKQLNERRRCIEKALKLAKDEKHGEAVAAFESVKLGEVGDPEVLLALSESYSQSGNPLQAARLCALASHAPNWRVPPGYMENIGRLLGNAHDLKGSLGVLAEVRLSSREPVWQEAMRLLEQSLAARVVRQTWKGPQKTWPTVAPLWEVTTETMLTSPCIGEGHLVIFGSADKDVLGSVFSDSETASHRGNVKTTFASALLYETYVYDLATGALKWQKSKLMSGTSTPVIAEGVLFAMGPGGPLAVSLKNGEVIWEDKSGRVKGPDVVYATGLDFGRPWWKMFELRRIGSHLVVWHPKEEAVHFYDAQSGKYQGAAYHNGTWSTVGQFFLQKPDGLYFLKRGSTQLEKLTDEQLANPADLTLRLRMLADPDAVVQDDSLFEVTRHLTASDTDRFDFFVVASDLAKGDFKWVYPLLSNQAPVIADGKLCIYRKSITGKQSAVVQMIDVDKQETKTVDLSELDISLYEPTLALAGGKNVLLGSQAVISAADGKVVWVNRDLPVTRDPRIVGKYLFVPPFLLESETGKIVMELQGAPNLSWQQAVFVSGDERLVVANSNGSVRKGGATSAEGKIRLFATVVPAAKPPAEAPAAEKPEAVPAEAPPSLEDFEKTFLESDIAPPLGAHVYDLFQRIASATYEGTANPAKAVEYLAKALKMRPHNAKHLIQLAQMIKPYASMAGEYDQFLTLLGEIKNDYKRSAEAVAAVVEEEKAAQSEKLESANAAKYFETVKTAEHDPLEDWPSDRPASGTGNRGSGAAPPFNVGWTQKIPRAGLLDRLAPTESVLFELQEKSHTLVALKPSDGGKLWEAPDVQTFVYYRGVVYVVGKDLRALTPREGQVLWRKRLAPGDVTGDVAMAAGQDLIFLALREGIAAFDWASGLDVYRLDLPGKNRLDLHGSVLVASLTQTGKLYAVEAKTGVRLWSADVGAYSLFDGKLYSVRLDPDTKPPELLLICYHVPTGRELWRRHYDVPLVQRKPVVLRPALSFDEILVVCDRNLLQLKRETGEVLAKQTLPGDVTQPIVATPALVYLSGVSGKLTAYDLANSLAQVWELPTSGKEVVSVDGGTLYVLDGEELKAYRGEKQSYSAEHLKALVSPSEELPGVGAETLREVKIRPAPFISIGSIRDKKELVRKLDDKRLSDMAFYQLLNVGQLHEWKMMIEETMSMKAPGERKIRPLTEPEIRLLYAEMIQRREPTAMELVKDALRSGDRKRTKMVIELMATGDRATYGPMLLQVFRDALKNKEYMTETACAEAVASWGYEPGQSLLITGLADDKSPDNVRSACAEALAAFDTPEAARALVKVAREEARPALSKQCTEFLVRKGEEGIKAVGAILADPSASERSRIDAASAFTKAKGAEAIPYLLSALNNEQRKYTAKLQAAAATSLGPLSGFRPDVVPALLSQMNNTKNDGYLRNACMAGLGTSKDPAVIPHLIAVMGNRDVDNRKFTNMSAHQFLVLLTGEKDVGQYPEEWRQWWEKNKDRFKEKP